MTRRRILWVLGGLAGLAGLAAVGPYVYWHARGEHLFRLRPTSYWRRDLWRWDLGWHQARPPWSPDWPERALALLGVKAAPPRPPVLEGDPDALPVLLDLLRDEEVWARRWACEGLGRVDRPEAVCALLGALMDPDESVREQASLCFPSGRRPVLPGAVDVLCGVLENGDTDSRRLAAECLGVMGPDARAAVPLLLRDRDHPNIRLRSTVYYALRALDPASVEGRQPPVEVGRPGDGHDEEG